MSNKIDIESIVGDIIDRDEDGYVLSIYKKFPAVGEKAWCANLSQYGREFRSEDEDLEAAVTEVVYMYKHYMAGVNATEKLKQAAEKHGLDISHIE